MDKFIVINALYAFCLTLCVCVLVSFTVVSFSAHLLNRSNFCLGFMGCSGPNYGAGFPTDFVTFYGDEYFQHIKFIESLPENEKSKWTHKLEPQFYYHISDGLNFDTNNVFYKIVNFLKPAPPKEGPDKLIISSLSFNAFVVDVSILSVLLCFAYYLICFVFKSYRSASKGVVNRLNLSRNVADKK